MKYQEMSTAELRSILAEINGELTRRANGSIPIWDGRNGQVGVAPSGGALLEVEWAVKDQSYQDWYPSEDAALAALHILAASHGRVPVNGQVDLTARGCHASYAVVRVTEQGEQR